MYYKLKMIKKGTNQRFKLSLTNETIECLRIQMENTSEIPISLRALCFSLTEFKPQFFLQATDELEVCLNDKFHSFKLIASVDKFAPDERMELKYKDVIS